MVSGILSHVSWYTADLKWKSSVSSKNKLLNCSLSIYGAGLSGHYLDFLSTFSIGSILPFSLRLESNFCGEMLEQDTLGISLPCLTCGPSAFLIRLKVNKGKSISTPSSSNKNQKPYSFKNSQGLLCLLMGKKGREEL